MRILPFNSLEASLSAASADTLLSPSPKNKNKHG